MTLGGVVPQNGKLMTIVPLDEKLLVEARISPRDIAFIRPDQEALVKLLPMITDLWRSKRSVISPDTLRDEVKQDQFYYRVYIRTDSDKLRNAAGQEFNITPGMVALSIFVPVQNGNGLSDRHSTRLKKHCVNVKFKSI